jgi:glycerate-2-kinase
MLEQSRRHQRPASLISGGEFACPVGGTGIGGRNLETVLRCAIALDQRRNSLVRDSSSVDDSPHIVFLSAGTDGIDGNSEVAGAIADQTTVARGRAMGLDARQFLENSDAFNYFKALKDTVFTSPTGTNVRDLRILLVNA